MHWLASEERRDQQSAYFQYRLKLSWPAQHMLIVGDDFLHHVDFSAHRGNLQRPDDYSAADAERHSLEPMRSHRMLRTSFMGCREGSPNRSIGRAQAQSRTEQYANRRREPPDLEGAVL